MNVFHQALQKCGFTSADSLYIAVAPPAGSDSKLNIVITGSLKETRSEAKQHGWPTVRYYRIDGKPAQCVALHANGVTIAPASIEETTALLAAFGLREERQHDS